MAATRESSKTLEISKGMVRCSAHRKRRNNSNKSSQKLLLVDVTALYGRGVIIYLFIFFGVAVKYVQ